MALFDDLKRKYSEMMAPVGQRLSNLGNEVRANVDYVASNFKPALESNVVKPVQRGVANVQWGLQNRGLDPFKIMQQPTQYPTVQNATRTLEVYKDMLTAKPYRELLGSALRTGTIAATGGKIDPKFLASDETIERKYATPWKTAISGAMDTMSAAALTNPIGALTYRSFPGVYGAIKGLREGQSPLGVANEAMRGMQDYAGPSRALGLENTTLGGVVDTGEMIAGLFFNKGVDDMTLRYGKNMLKRAQMLGIKGVSPRANSIHPDDLAIMQEYWYQVKKLGNKKEALGQLGADAQRIAEHYLGKNWTNTSNERIANAFEWAIDLNAHLPRDARAKLPGMSLYGGESATGYQTATKFSNLTDKKPRFEIDDSGAKIDENSLYISKWQDQPLSQILNHDELFKNYPEIAKTKVQMKFLGDGVDAYFDPRSNKLFVNLTYEGKPEELKSFILHETQHRIQQMEDLAKGGSPDMFLPEAYTQSPYIVVKQAFNKYKRLAAEVEARDVQSRMNLTAEERLHTQPLISQGIPLKDQIVRFDESSQYQASLPKPLQELGNQIKNFASRYLRSSEHRRLEVLPAQPKTVQVLRNNLNILDGKNYKHIIDSDGIKHAFRGHGKDTLPITENDLGLIPGILSNPDKLTLSKYTTGRAMPALVYEKKIGNNVFYIEEVHVGRKELIFKTMYKKGSGGEAPSYLASSSRPPKGAPNSEPNISIPPTVKPPKGATNNLVQRNTAKPVTNDLVQRHPEQARSILLNQPPKGVGVPDLSKKPTVQDFIQSGEIKKGSELVSPKQQAIEKLDNLVNYPGRLKSMGYTDRQIKMISAKEGERILTQNIPPFAHETFNRADDALDKIGMVPPQHQAEMKTIDKTIGNKKVNILDYFRTPDRVLKKLGLEKQALEIRKGYQNYIQELPKEIDRVNAWYKEVGGDQGASQRIFKWLDGQKIALSGKELKVATEIRTYLKSWADKLDLPEDKRIAHYITHIFENDLIQKDFDPDLAKLIADKVPGSTYDPFLQQRLGKRGYVEDVFRALDAYVKRATRKYNMDPALSSLRGKVGRTVEESPLDIESWNYVKRYVDNINMRPQQVDKLLDNLVKQSPVGYSMGDRPTTVVSQKLRQMVYRGTLGLNINSALKNLTQGVNTYAKLGEKYTGIGYLKGIKGLLTKDPELKNVLADSFIQDRNLSAKKKLIETVDKGLFALFDAVEKINRSSAYYGGKAKALAQGLSEEEAIQAGIDLARDTQFTFGSVDTAVALQGDLAKTLLQFQSYNIKQAEFLSEMVKNKEFGGMARWLGANLLVVAGVGELLGIEFKDLIPSVRIGSSPIFELGKDVGGAIVNSPDQYGNPMDTEDRIKDAGKDLVPFIPGGVQIKKSAEGINAYNQGASKTASGKVRFNIDQTPVNFVKAATLGQYRLPGSQEYFNKKDEKSGGLLERLLKPQNKVGAAEAIPSNKQDLKILLDDAESTIRNYNKNKIKAQYGLVDKSLEDYQDEVDAAIQLKKQIQTQQPKLYLDTQFMTYGKDHPSDIEVEDRAAWAVDQLKNVTDTTKRQELINRMWDEGVLTSKSNGTVQYIKDNFGIDVSTYTGKGKVTVKKPKKIALKKITPIKVSLPKSKPIKRVKRKKVVRRKLIKVRKVV